MNTLETQCCPECESSLVDDSQNGELICSGCGIVVADQIADYGPEAIGSSLEDKMKLARATGQTTYSQHDLGITTEISISSKDFSGKSINSEVANQMHNLRKWQQRVRVSSPRERRLANVLTKIGEACQGLSLSKNVQETASMIYRNLDGQIEVKGKSVVSISVATIYMACKQCDVVRSLEEICRGICQPKDVKAKTKLAARYYRTMVMEMGSKTAPVVTMDKYISKIANLTKTEVRVERLALEIAEKTKNNNLADGKAPNGIAAAYLYVASILLGQNVLQRDVSSIAGVTEVTIRNRCKEILTSYKLKIALRPSLAKK
ncbi:transcription factor IIB [Nitrosopumilus sp. b1]|uniref:transcription initiation factor IIB n=1 Tax=Nitrosopumilus sp. b1 TaxID=2109907 RepID=UPI0015F521A5|nr:TFIIB-type zinc ribbon-containing protein [Nitrosopumilus sp. b1]KAF6242626.1 transcription factor IIB [Nitrosopumilus sp. b1]